MASGPPSVKRGRPRADRLARAAANNLEQSLQGLQEGHCTYRELYGKRDSWDHGLQRYRENGLMYTVLWWLLNVLQAQLVCVWNWLGPRAEEDLFAREKAVVRVWQGVKEKNPDLPLSGTLVACLAWVLGQLPADTRRWTHLKTVLEDLAARAFREARSSEEAKAQARSEAASSSAGEDPAAAAAAAAAQEEHENRWNMFDHLVYCELVCPALAGLGNNGNATCKCQHASFLLGAICKTHRHG